jgi:hypothetical protein
MAPAASADRYRLGRSDGGRDRVSKHGLRQARLCGERPILNAEFGPRKYPDGLIYHRDAKRTLG